MINSSSRAKEDKGKMDKNIGQAPEDKKPGLWRQMQSNSVDPDKLGRYSHKMAKVSALFSIAFAIMFAAFGYFAIFPSFKNSLPAESRLTAAIVLAIFIVIDLLVILASVGRYRRINTITIEPNLDFDAANSIVISSGEKVRDFIVGICRAGWGNYGVEINGIGENNYPENALLLTDKQILFAVVPVAGVDKIIDGVYIGEQQFRYSREKIAEKLQSFLNQMPLSKFAKSHKNNFSIPLSEVKVHIGTGMFGTIDFHYNGQKVRYTFPEKSDYKKAKEMFVNYLT